MMWARVMALILGWMWLAAAIGCIAGFILGGTDSDGRLAPFAITGLVGATLILCSIDKKQLPHISARNISMATFATTGVLLAELIYEPMPIRWFSVSISFVAAVVWFRNYLRLKQEHETSLAAAVKLAAFKLPRVNQEDQ